MLVYSLLTPVNIELPTMSCRFSTAVTVVPTSQLIVEFEARFLLGIAIKTVSKILSRIGT